MGSRMHTDIFFNNINTRSDCIKHKNSDKYKTVIIYCPYCVEEKINDIVSSSVAVVDSGGSGSGSSIGSCSGIIIGREFVLNKTMLIPFTL